MMEVDRQMALPGKHMAFFKENRCKVVTVIHRCMAFLFVSLQLMNPVVTHCCVTESFSMIQISNFSVWSRLVAYFAGKQQEFPVVKKTHLRDFFFLFYFMLLYDSIPVAILYVNALYYTCMLHKRNFIQYISSEGT